MWTTRTWAEASGAALDRHEGQDSRGSHDSHDHDSQEDAGAEYVSDHEDLWTAVRRPRSAAHDASVQPTEAQKRRSEENHRKALAIRAAAASNATASNAAASNAASDTRAAGVAHPTSNQNNADTGVGASGVEALNVACLQVLFQVIKKYDPDIQFHSVLRKDGILVKTTPEDREILGVDFRNEANDAFRRVIGAAGQTMRVDIRVKEVPLEGGYTLAGGVDEDEVRRLDRRTDGLVRELALQSGHTDDADVDAVMDNVAVICADLVILEDKRYEVVYHALVFDAIKEWRARGGLSHTLSKQEFDELVENARIDPSKTTKRAFEALWTRRRKCPVLAFKTSRLNVGDGLAERMLKNIDIDNTDVRSLVLTARALDSSIRAQQTVFNFVTEHCTSEQAGELHARHVFDETWKTAMPSDNFTRAVKDHLEFMLDSHPFIVYTIPSIVQKPIRRHWEGKNGLCFELDFTHDAEDPLQRQASVDGGSRSDQGGDGMDCDGPCAQHQDGGAVDSDAVGRDAMDCDAVDSDATDGDGQSGQQDAPQGHRRSSRRHQPVVFQLDHATGYMTSSEVGRGVLH